MPGAAIRKTARWTYFRVFFCLRGAGNVARWTYFRVFFCLRGAGNAARWTYFRVSSVGAAPAMRSYLGVFICDASQRVRPW
jgi:hypothetical protein